MKEKSNTVSRAQAVILHTGVAEQFFAQTISIALWHESDLLVDVKRPPTIAIGRSRTAIVTTGVFVVIGSIFLALPFIMTSSLSVIFGALWAAGILSTFPSGFALLIFAFMAHELKRSYYLMPWILVGPAIGEFVYSRLGTEVHSVNFVEAGYADLSWALGLVVLLALVPNLVRRWAGPLVALNFATSRTTQAATILTAMDTNDFASGIWTPLAMYLSCIAIFAIVALLIGRMIFLIIRTSPTSPQRDEAAQIDVLNFRLKIAGFLLLSLSLAWQVGRLFHWPFD